MYVDWKRNWTWIAHHYILIPLINWGTWDIDNSNQLHFSIKDLIDSLLHLKKNFYHYKCIYIYAQHLTCWNPHGKKPIIVNKEKAKVQSVLLLCNSFSNESLLGKSSISEKKQFEFFKDFITSWTIIIHVRSFFISANNKYSIHFM